MTNPQKTQYWRKYATLNAKLERVAYYIILKAFKQCMDDVIASIEQRGAQETLNLLDAVIQKRVINQAYQDVYYQVGTKAKDWTDQDVKTRFQGKKEEDRRPMRIPNFKPPKPETITPRMGVGFFNPAWLARLKQIVNGLDVAERVTSVTDTFRSRIKKSLSESLQQFVSFKKIVAKLRRDTGGMYSVRQAQVIARTEVTHITNIAAEQSANETGLKLMKMWISTKDDRTRDSHVKMGYSKIIKEDELFIVGPLKKKMKYPGDPAGGLPEIINCRCICAYVPADDYQDFEDERTRERENAPAIAARFDDFLETLKPGDL